jgi:hypothetical protein
VDYKLVAVAVIVGRFRETPSENRDLAMMASDTDARQGVDDRELSFGRAHHDFHAPIGTLLFD